jgi:nitrile hydratase
LPRYVRGKAGVIERDWGVFVFPDTNAHHAGTKPQHCYSVAFDARELWGKSAKANCRERVYLDLWEDYLEPIAPKSKTKAAKRTTAHHTGRY